MLTGDAGSRVFNQKADTNPDLLPFFFFKAFFFKYSNLKQNIS